MGYRDGDIPETDDELYRDLDRPIIALSEAIPPAKRAKTKPLTDIVVGLDRDGPDGNAFVILGTIRGELKRYDRANGTAFAGEFLTEATKGDYDHLMATARKYVSFTVPKWVRER